MQSARLIVKNFGPLKDIDIEVRDFLCLIGKQATGKSTIAKLIAIFEDEKFRKDDNLEFKSELEKFGMNFFHKENTEIIYESNSFNFEFKKNKGFKLKVRENLKKRIFQSLEGNDDNRKKAVREFISNEFDNNHFDIKKIMSELLKELEKNQDEKFSNTQEATEDFLRKTDVALAKIGVDTLFDSQYIPSERNFLHIIAENTLGLINNDVKIPKHLLEIGQEYEKALNVVKEIPLNLIDKKYSYKREGKTSYIYHNKEEKDRKSVV